MVRERLIRRPRGFTLIELLAVLAIMSVLASLLFAAVFQTRNRVRSTQCLVRLSQLGQALMIYGNDENVYPAVPRVAVNGMRPPAFAWFRNELAGNPEVTRCPADVAESYHYNAYGSGGPNSRLGLGGDGTDPLPQSAVRNPSDMIAISDTVYMSFPPRIRLASPTQPIPRIYPHNEGLNVVFCDGHVEHSKRHQLIAPNDRARRRWNYDNQPHPETW